MLRLPPSHSPLPFAKKGEGDEFRTYGWQEIQTHYVRNP